MIWINVPATFHPFSGISRLCNGYEGVIVNAHECPATADPQAREIVRKCRMFHGLEPEWRDVLASIAVLRRFKRNERIFSQGDPVPGLYCVGQGLVRIFKLAPSGKEHVLHFADPGKTFAEVAALGGFTCPANAAAVEETLCALLPNDRLHALLRQHHALCLQLLSGMALWVRQLVALIEDLVLRDAGGRVAGHLLASDPTGGRTDASGGGTDATRGGTETGRRPAFTLPMLKKDLASHLNLTSETLSRTLRRLAEAGLIEMGEGSREIRILDPTRLRQVAEGLLPAEFE